MDYMLVQRLMKMLQLAPLNRVPFGKFNRASAFPVVRLRRTAGSFNCTNSYPITPRVSISSSTPNFKNGL
jgi:hypothetical protein